MHKELSSAKLTAEEAKSTWEKLRKERDYHKHHIGRVSTEKVTITENIKRIKSMNEEYEEKIEEVKKKVLQTQKEKALLKLEKDKLQKRAFDLQNKIKANEEKVQRQIDLTHKKQRDALNQSPVGQMTESQLMGVSSIGKGTKKFVNWPEDARPNPLLATEYEPLANRLSSSNTI